MPSSKPPLHVANELGILLDGQSLEVLIDELVDPGSHFSRGQRAKIGAALIGVGNAIYEGAKIGMEGVQADMDADVIFKWRGESSQTRVDAAQVKKQYPQSAHPSLYSKTSIKAGVNIEVPFNKDEIALPKRVQDQPSEENDFPDFATAQGSLSEPFA